MANFIATKGFFDTVDNNSNEDGVLKIRDRQESIQERKLRRVFKHELY